MSDVEQKQVSKAFLISAIALPVFLAVSNQTMISVALPAIGKDLVELGRLPWLIVGYMLALTIAGPVYGALGDIYGRRSMLMAALWVYVAGSLVCTFAPSVEILAGGRLIQGFGGGGLMSLSQALIGQLVPDRDRGKMQGYVATIGVVASTVGPLFGGFSVDILGWRSLFLVTIPLAFIGMVLLQRLPTSHSRRIKRKFDFVGLLWLNIFVLGWVIGLECLKSPDTYWMAAICAVIGAVGLYKLVQSQGKFTKPLFPPQLFKMKEITRTVYLVIFHGAALVSLVVIVPLYLRIVFGYATVDVAWVLLALTFGLGSGGVFTGNMITKTGYTALFPTIGLLVTVGTLSVVAFWGHDFSKITLACILFIGAFGMGGVMSVAHTTIQKYAPDDLRGAASGIVTFSRSIGGVLGSTIVTLVLFGMAEVPDVSSAEILALLTSPENLDPAYIYQWQIAFRAAFLSVSAFAFLSWIMAATTPARRI